MTEPMIVTHAQPGEFKGYLLGRLCPVFVTNPGEDCHMRPRLWGRLTFPIISWYCGVFLNEFPVVIRGTVYRL